MQIGIFECTGIMGQDLVHPYIQSITVLCGGLGGARAHWPTHIILSTSDRESGKEIAPLQLPFKFSLAPLLYERS